MSPLRSVTGWAVIRFTGPEPEKLLTMLGRKGVPFRDAEPPEDFSFTLRVPLRCAKRAMRLAASAGGEAELLERRGFPAAAGRLRRRRLPALLAAAALAFLLWNQAYIWSIDVTGNETVPEGALRQALAECGVDVGRRWVGMRQDAVRDGVILRVPGIRWMTVTMQGSRAHVIVRESREAIEPVPEEECAKVTADRVGLVTHVYALRGTAEAEENRFVLPGDTVVGGYATGRWGVQGAVRAIGYAEARTWYDITAAAPSELGLKIPTGEKTVRYSVILGKRRINIYKDSSICPPECDKIIEDLTLAVPGVFTLPVAVERTTVAPYETLAVTAEELPEELSQTLREELVRRIGETGEIVSEEYSVWEADGMTYVSLAAECREQIGETVPLTAGEIAEIESKIPKTAEE